MRYKLKFNNYSELIVVNVADIWKETCGIRGEPISGGKIVGQSIYRRIKSFHRGIQDDEKVRGNK